MAVHLAGVTAFLILGLYATDHGGGKGRREMFLYAVVIFGLLVLSAFSRGAFVTISVTLLAAFLFRPSVRLFQFAAAGALLLPILLVLQPSIRFGAREFSAEQLTKNVTSLFSPQEGTELAGTRSFREDWWDTIISYTVHGPYFWTGKGFGVNLADDDGFQVLEDGSLRSPHNGHMNILARMGVPGFALWLTILGAFALTMLRARQLFLRNGDTVLAGMAAWILVYWIAASTNASFDVYIEGPQGGIWFWTLTGLGIGLAMLAGEAQPEKSSRARAPIRGIHMRSQRMARAGEHRLVREV
jgi:O-antigen ligase